MTDNDIRPGDAPQTAIPERSISPIAGRLGPGRAGKALVVTALAAGCGLFMMATWRGQTPRAHAAPEQPAQQVVPFEGLKDSAPAGPTLTAPGANAPSLTAGGAPGAPATSTQPGAAAGTASAAAEAPTRAQSELAAIRSAPLVAYSRTGGGFTAGLAAAAAPIVPAIEPAGAATELDQLRRGSGLGLARASRLPDRNLLIVAGAAIPCLLQTAMDTATPGYVSCLIPRDVYSDNGAVVLLEKGTKVLGEYRSSLKQGQNRLFVLWTRAVTPAGVAIRLESPAADALGRAGFDGSLDTHFWDRFGGALLLSIVDDGTNALAASNAAPATTRVPSDAAAVALQNSVNIPPSLRKPQGAEVSIFVAQDFDFSGVYALKAR
jgi:type IV secretion system protein VirB10